MIPQVISNNVKTNTESDFNFTIKTSAHAFKILSDSLYSNKILAVVREYLTNALDAHRENNKLDTPIETNLSMDNEWTVRDYGKGLSGEDIQNLFCTYFSSSKTDTNEQTGMLGLGCKSGFAYTDQFTVTSWFNNKETIYHLYIEDLVPKVSIISYKDSDEPTGLQISIPIKSSDINEFLNTEKHIFRFFPKGVIPEKYIEYVEEYFKGVDELPSSYITKFDTPYVLMGNVLYPLDISLLGDSSKNYLYNKTIYRIFKVPIGAINILPSREGLSYDKKTKDYLLKLINKSIDEVNGLIGSIRKEQKPKKYNKFGKGNVDFNYISQYIHPIYKVTSFKYNYKYFPFNIKFEKYKTYKYYTDTCNYIIRSEFTYKPLNDIFILETKQRSPKENKLITKWLEQEGNNRITVYVYKTKHKKMHKPLRKYLKTIVSNKIFNSYSEFFKYAYGEINPKLDKPKVKTTVTKSKPKAKTYELLHINSNNTVKLTLKEIKELSKDRNNYFVSNSYGLISAVNKLNLKQQVYIVEDYVKTVLWKYTLINYTAELEVLIKKEILINHKQDLIVFHLIRMISNNNFWGFLRTKTSELDKMWEHVYIGLSEKNCVPLNVNNDLSYILFVTSSLKPTNFKNIFELNITNRSILKRIKSLILKWLKERFGETVVFYWFNKENMYPRNSFESMLQSYNLQEFFHELLKDIANDLVNLNQYYSK